MSTRNHCTASWRTQKAVRLGIAVDDVTLWRCLVEARYLRRDRQGINYGVQIVRSGEERFEREVGSAISAAVAHAARGQAVNRKREQSGQTPQRRTE